MNTIEKFKLSHDMEKEFEWGKWMKEIPYLSFPSQWQIQVIPPFRGVIIRFRVKLLNSLNDVSVYLDCYNQLGIFGSPYWEVYPYNGDTFRCAMNDTDELIKAITESLGEEVK